MCTSDLPEGGECWKYSYETLDVLDMHSAVFEFCFLYFCNTREGMGATCRRFTELHPQHIYFFGDRVLLIHPDRVQICIPLFWSPK